MKAIKRKYFLSITTGRKISKIKPHAIKKKKKKKSPACPRSSLHSKSESSIQPAHQIKGMDLLQAFKCDCYSKNIKEPGTVVHNCNTNTWEAEKKDQTLQVIWRNLVISRLSWATWDTVIIQTHTKNIEVKNKAGFLHARGLFIFYLLFISYHPGEIFFSVGLLIWRLGRKMFETHILWHRSVVKNPSKLTKWCCWTCCLVEPSLMVSCKGREKTMKYVWSGFTQGSNTSLKMFQVLLIDKEKSYPGSGGTYL